MIYKEIIERKIKIKEVLTEEDIECIFMQIKDKDTKELINKLIGIRLTEQQRR